MRMRIVSAAVVLGLGIVGITLAQQGGQQPKDRASEKAKLGAQVAKLRAEVEVLQLEHDVDADILRKLMTDVKNLDGMEALKGPMKEQLKALKETMAKQAPDQPAGALLLPMPSLDGANFNKMFALDEATAKVARPLLDAKKKDFAKQATELAEKRLELAEVEKRYNEAK
jgi:hypothetical protein